MRDFAPLGAELRAAAWEPRRSLTRSVAGVRRWAGCLLDAGARLGFIWEVPALPVLGLDGLLDPLAETALASRRSEGTRTEPRAPDTLEVGEWVRPGAPGPGVGNAAGVGSALEPRTSRLMGSGGDPFTAGPAGAPALPSPSTPDSKARRADRVLHPEPTDRVGRRARHRSETSDRPDPSLGSVRPIAGTGAGPGSSLSNPRDPTPSESGRARGEEWTRPAPRRREIRGPIANFVPTLPGRPASLERAGEPGTSPRDARDTPRDALRTTGDRPAWRTAASGSPTGLRSPHDDPAESFPGRRGGSGSRIADVLGPVGVPARGQELADSDPSLDRMVRLLQDVVGELGAISARLAEGGDRSLGSGRSEPAVRWLEDDELAGRLQRILMRQARSRGIDLS